MKLKMCDNGIGIRSSYLLNDNFAKDDRSAILLALSGVSAKKKNERAFGLYSIRQRTEYLQGKMEICSGNRKVVITKDKMEFTESKRRQQGVSVQVETNVKRLNIYEVIK